MAIEPILFARASAPSEVAPSASAKARAPIAVEKLPLAVDTEPTAVELTPRASESTPTAVASSASARDNCPTAVEKLPVAVELVPHSVDSGAVVVARRGRVSQGHARQSQSRSAGKDYGHRLRVILAYHHFTPAFPAGEWPGFLY